MINFPHIFFWLFSWKFSTYYTMTFFHYITLYIILCLISWFLMIFSTYFSMNFFTTFDEIFQHITHTLNDILYYDSFYDFYEVQLLHQSVLMLGVWQLADRRNILWVACLSCLLKHYTVTVHTGFGLGWCQCFLPAKSSPVRVLSVLLKSSLNALRLTEHIVSALKPQLVSTF